MIKAKQHYSSDVTIQVIKDILVMVSFCMMFINNFIMHNQKSCGISTKSSSNFLNSPLKQSAKAKAFMLEQAKERENTFLRDKNQQLRELVLRMGEEIMKINKDKNALLALNSKYIDTLNKQFKQNHLLFDRLRVQENLPKNASTCKCKILMEFQNDYRDLVKHCMDLEQQIKSKNGEIMELQFMKKELARSNHTSISELIEELIDTTHELVTLKKTYNRQEFQLQKLTQKQQRMQQTNKDTHKAASSLAYQIENYKSLINTMTNEYIDKENNYKSKIYSLQLTIQKLQKDVRETQKQKDFISVKNSILKAEKIEFLQNQSEEKGSLNNSRMVRSQSMQRSRKR